MQVKTTHTVNVIPGAGTKESSPTPVLSEIPDAFALSWSGDKELLVSKGSDLIEVGRDGKNRRTLASDATGNIDSAHRCGEQYVVFSWAFHGGSNGMNIWRLNADGSDAMQLTNSKTNANPICSPDGRWVYYQDQTGDRILRVSIEGGKSEIVPGTMVFDAGIAAAPWRSLAGREANTVFQSEHFRSKDVKIVNLDAGPNPTRRTLSPDSRVAGASCSLRMDAQWPIRSWKMGSRIYGYSRSMAHPGARSQVSNQGRFTASVGRRTESRWL